MVFRPPYQFPMYPNGMQMPAQMPMQMRMPTPPQMPPQSFYPPGGFPQPRIPGGFPMSGGMRGHSEGKCQHHLYRNLLK